MATAHSATHALLLDYATDAALGMAPHTAYPHVAAHLETCADCRAVLDELVDLTVAAYGAELDAAPAYPHVDLSFLQAR